MKYCEIIIGHPGSGKSTYISRKMELLSHRSLYTINLDPGASDKSHFNYSITDFYSLSDYQKKRDIGPNAGVKQILADFVYDLENFYSDHIDENDAYFIIDLPGQIEFFISDDSLSKFIRFLTTKGISMCIVNLVDIVFFRNHILSTYLFSALPLALLDVPHVNVISKCDKYQSLDFPYDLEEISNFMAIEREYMYYKTNIKIKKCKNKSNESENKLENQNFLEENLKTVFEGDYTIKSKFLETICDFIINEPLPGYFILDYENEQTLKYLQVSIDKSCGYFFDDTSENDSIYQMLDFEDIFDKYKTKQNIN